MKRPEDTFNVSSGNNKDVSGYMLVAQVIKRSKYKCEYNKLTKGFNVKY